MPLCVVELLWRYASLLRQPECSNWGAAKHLAPNRLLLMDDGSSEHFLVGFPPAPPPSPPLLLLATHLARPHFEMGMKVTNVSFC